VPVINKVRGEISASFLIRLLVTTIVCQISSHVIEQPLEKYLSVRVIGGAFVD
jgi:hypothetical protein